MNSLSIFPDSESFALYLAGPFLSAFLAYAILHLALAVIEWVTDRGVSVLDLVGNTFRDGGSDDDNDLDGYADMDLPQVEGFIEVEGRSSLHADQLNLILTVTMTDQLVEDLEYNPQSEEINCLAEAQAVASNLGRDLRHQAALVVASGRVVVLTIASYFCRSTDALAGEYPCAIDVADTVSEAQAIACRIESSDEELRAEVLIPDALKPAPVVCVTVDDSEIPF